MKVLVVGAGGREHAIVHALSRSAKVNKIFSAPGNAGIAELAECINIKDTEVDKLLVFAKDNKIDLTIVGPESSLALGIVDKFKSNDLKIFGPTQSAARIESSKEFAKDLMKRNNIPTATYEVFRDYESALEYVQSKGAPIVLKYDGLAAGKGVVVAETLKQAEEALKEMLLDDKFGHGKVVIEECLTGPEFSFLCFVSGDKAYPMPESQDHKRAYDGDLGPNTGGMGAYTPVPFITEEDKEYALNKIVIPTAKALINEGDCFTGVLYAGLMKTPQGIKVIEFNCRFGDPETEVILPLLESDIYDIFESVAECKEVGNIKWNKQAALGIVLASKGYPDAYDKGIEIIGLENINQTIYHMGTTRNAEGQLLTNGGRVLFLTAIAQTLQEAQNIANEEVKKVNCNNLFYRTDIGNQINN